jgi:hypothetical protein
MSRVLLGVETQELVINTHQHIIILSLKSETLKDTQK